MAFERKRCSDHCATCGEHFASEEAFDAHRTGSYNGKRRCRKPEKVVDLGVLIEHGTCDIYPGQESNDCRVWQIRTIA